MFMCPEVICEEGKPEKYLWWRSREFTDCCVYGKLSRRKKCKAHLMVLRRLTRQLESLIQDMQDMDTTSAKPLLNLKRLTELDWTHWSKVLFWFFLLKLWFQSLEEEWRGNPSWGFYRWWWWRCRPAPPPACCTVEWRSNLCQRSDQELSVHSVLWRFLY